MELKTSLDKKTQKKKYTLSVQTLTIDSNKAPSKKQSIFVTVTPYESTSDKKMTEFVGINMPDFNFYGNAHEMDVYPQYRELLAFDPVSREPIDGNIVPYVFYEK